MKAGVSDMDGVGPMTLAIFKRAGLHSSVNIASLSEDTVWQRLRDAIDTSAEKFPDLDQVHWACMFSRCRTIVLRLRNHRPLPPVPDCCACPITLDWMHDPVSCPSGATYERAAILKQIRLFHRDPFTHEPLQESDLVPNQSARDCIEFILRNSMALSS